MYNPSMKTCARLPITLSLKKKKSLVCMPCIYFFGYCTCQFALHIVPHLKCIPRGGPRVVTFCCTCGITTRANDNHQLNVAHNKKDH